MGELLKTYGHIDINGQRLAIELNEPINPQTGGIVHLQSDKFRLEMSQADFYRLVVTINLAKKNLCRIKGLNDE